MSPDDVVADERLTEYYSKRYSLYHRAVLENDPASQRRVALLLKLKDPALTELVEENFTQQAVLDRRWGKCEARERRLSYLRSRRIRRPLGRAPRRACNAPSKGSRRVTRAGPSSDDDPHEDDPDDDAAYESARGVLA